MNSKQLFLATALITSLSSIAMADVSISGEAKVNSRGGMHTMEADLTITGKSGDNSVVAQLGLDNSNIVEQLYMKSKVAGIGVKVGTWKKQKSELSRSVIKPPTILLSTDINGIKLKYWDMEGPGGTRVSVSGVIDNTDLMYKFKNEGRHEIKAVGPIGDIDTILHLKYIDGLIEAQTLTLKTSVDNIEITLVDVAANDFGGTPMDGFFGKYDNVQKAQGVGFSTQIAGNKVTLKTMNMTVNGVNDDKSKLILTRKIASGATFEATYIDSESNDDALDLELAVKF